MIKTTKRKNGSAPKSQSDTAAEKRSKALERAGDAVLAGDTKKAAQLVKGKPLNGPQALEIVNEARSIVMRIEAIRHQIDAVKEEYAELKSEEKKLIVDLVIQVRDGNQGKLPFETQPTYVDSKTGEVLSAEPENDIERAIAGDEGLPPPAERAARSGRRTRRATHEAGTAA